MQPDIQSREHHKHSLAAQVLRTAGTLRLAARGYSMLPTLWPGDVLAIEAQSFDRVQVGDVVLFAREERFYIHRILRKDKTAVGNRLITRGDSMPEADVPVLPEELLGKVVATEFRAGRVAVPACSRLRRQIGLMLAHSGRLRSLALRWHAWRFRGRNANSDLSVQEVSLG
jgi:signal peptidase I